MLHLRPFRRNDAKEIIKWCHDEDSFCKWSAGILGAYPITEERMLAAVSGREDNDRYFPFVLTEDDEVVGFFQFRHPGDDRDELRFGFVIVNPEIRGRGYGKKMLQLGIKFAFEVYGAKKVSLGVFENNSSAYHCYRSVGFAEIGDISEYEINGNIWNCIEMELSSTD